MYLCVYMRICIYIYIYIYVYIYIKSKAPPVQKFVYTSHSLAIGSKNNFASRHLEDLLESADVDCVLLVLHFLASGPWPSRSSSTTCVTCVTCVAMAAVHDFVKDEPTIQMSHNANVLI